MVKDIPEEDELYCMNNILYINDETIIGCEQEGPQRGTTLVLN